MLGQAFLVLVLLAITKDPALELSDFRMLRHMDLEDVFI
jgi:hypothetical protein